MSDDNVPENHGPEIAFRNGWNAAIREARRLQPPTAANPNEDAYQRGKFDGVMAYARVLIELQK